MKNLLMLKPKHLLTHPLNMRRFYPSADVREMANSIAAGKGVLQPLIVAKSDDPHKYVVIDGNMRLAGARLLGDECPALECKLVEQKEAEQKLSMVIANKIRYDVDPVSEGLHYHSLQKEGLSVRDISKRTGIYEARITNRKVLAELEEPIQQLIVEEKLPSSAEVARALLTLKPATRIKLAERFAQNPGIKIATILNACERLANKDGGGKKMKNPATQLSGAARGGTAAAGAVREAAQKVCHSCTQYEGQLAKNPEPAWSMVVHAADSTCDNCSLKEMQKVCGSCPAVELLRKLVKGGADGRAR